MTKIMNKRLSSILAANSVLKGNNYASLPGSNCASPIAILESIIQDAKSHNKLLFIFLQDISKAFDSMDVNMLLCNALKFHQGSSDWLPIFSLTDTIQLSSRTVS